MSRGEPDPAIAISATCLRKSFPLKAGSLFRRWLGRVDGGPTHEVLRGVDLVIPKGEFLGVLGSNGAGKSTLLRVLAGVYALDSGEVTINGRLASLFELGGLGNTQLSGRSFALGYLSMIGASSGNVDALIADIHEFSELERYFDQKIATYSTGMAARLYFAVATSTQQDVYLIDEILAVGDEHFQVKSQVRMRERVSTGASGVLVTHDWASVIRLCRAASVLADGRLSDPVSADIAVAHYLDLAPPASSIASLVPRASYVGRTEEPLEIDFDVVVNLDHAVEVAVSIDALEPGIGWEPVVLTEFLSVGRTSGTHRVRLTLPYTPLRPGNYVLCLFLATPAEAATGGRTTLDVRTWTYGNGLPLVVHGDGRPDLAPFPVSWFQVSN